jgi:hypothetical protein
MAYDLGQNPPKRLGYRSVKGESYSGISSNEKLVAVAAHTSGLLLMDTQLEVVGRFDGLENAWDVLLGDDPDRVSGSAMSRNQGLAYVADGKNGLVVIDISKPDAPRVISRLELPGFAKKLAWGTAPDQLFIALGPAGVAKVSVRNKRKPKVMYRVDTPGTAVDLAVNGEALAVADWTSVRVYDATTKKTPSLLAVESTGDQMGRALSVSFRKDAIFVGDWTGVHILAPQLGSAVPIAEFDRGSGRILPNKTDPLEDTLHVTVRNRGTAELSIFGGSTRGEGFSSTVTERVVQPGGSTQVKVSFNSKTEQVDAEGQLVLCTNDPNAPEMTLPLKANPSSFGPGKAIPDVRLKLTKGEKWALSDHRGKPVLLAYFATF